MDDSRSRFLALAQHYNLIPVYREVLADLETPVSVFLKLWHDAPAAFLFESVEGGEHMARYSFLGARPLAALVHKDGLTRRLLGPEAAAPLDPSPGRTAGAAAAIATAAIATAAEPDAGVAAAVATAAEPAAIATAAEPDAGATDGEPGDPLGHLRTLLGGFRVAPPLRLSGTAPPTATEAAGQQPRFFGGAVGYLGYDAVRCYERLPGGPTDDLGLPDALFFVPQVLAVFDHLKHRLLVMVLAEPGADAESAYRRAVAQLDDAVHRLRGPVPVPDRPPPTRTAASAERELRSSTGHGPFLEMVRRAKDYIAAGDAFQIVLSQRLDLSVRAHPLDIYRVLRTINPSPYMFYLRCGDLGLIGASPEMLVRVEGGAVQMRPIAGTVPRGRTEAEDGQLEQALRQDEKERAEHLMLVDLGRNDLGRVCRFGSVTARAMMRVERYSHVMHLVTDLEGQLASDRDAFDALAACFPAGTLSGAPKVRAMEIIDELEPVRRGVYGGVVGYCGFDGALDTCIAIRTVVLRGDQAHIQAGAGIVADSDPEREYQETLHKARAVLRAVDVAEAGGVAP